MTQDERIADLEHRVSAIEQVNKPLGPGTVRDKELNEQRDVEIEKLLAKARKPTKLSSWTSVLTPHPVDRSTRILTNGKTESTMPDYRETDGTGMQKSYVVLSPEERTKGFVRPVRQSYRHNTCGAVTTMGVALAETYARDPGFYDGTFSATCHTHFPLDQFVWDGTTEQVGS